MSDSSRPKAAMAALNFVGARAVPVLALLAAVAGWTIMFPVKIAEAACSTSGTTTVTVTCAQDVMTSNTTNSISPNPASNAAVQQFGANITAQIAPGVTVSGTGLALSSDLAGTTISVTNRGNLASDGTVTSLNQASALNVQNNSVGGSGSLIVKNFGTITGAGGGFGLFVGVPAGGGNADITNNSGGTIQSIGGSAIGVTVGTSATITNNAGATIQALGSTLQSHGIDSDGPVVVNNAGVITGHVGILVNNTTGVPSSIFNSGTVNGTIEFLGTSGNTLTLAPGSIINGMLAGTGADIFQLGGGNGSGSVDLTSLFNAMAGFSTFNKVDNSTWTLKGTDAGNNTWTVQGGTLLVDGTTGGGMIVQAGATLGGVGTVGTTGIATGGILSPGHNGLGTLTINGNLLFVSGSFYQVTVNGSSAGLTTVNGTASLNNAFALVNFQGTSFSNAYTILVSQGLGGTTFKSLLTNSSVIKAGLTYVNDKDVVLNLTSNIGGGGNPPPGGGTPPPGGGGNNGNGGIIGLTRNQQMVANALDTACNIGGTCLTGIANVAAAQIPAALDALSGEGISGTQQTAFATGDTFLSMMMEQGAFWRSEGRTDLNGFTYPLGYAAETSAPAPFNAMAMATKAPAPAFAPRWRGWAAGFDGSGLLRGEAFPGSADQSRRITGGGAGLDYQYSPNLLVGAAAGGSSSSFSASDRLTSGSLDGAHLGTYGVARFAPWYVAGALQYAHFDNRTSRTIFGVGPTETASGRFGSDFASGRFETGWRFAFRNFAVTPFAAVQFAELWQRGFSESSIGPGGTAGGNALNFAAHNVSSFPTFLGAQLDGRYLFANGMIFSPQGRLSWVHEFDLSRSVTASFLALTDSTFTVDGPRAARDTARIDFGSQLALNARTSLFANFNGEFSDRSQTYAGRGGLKVYW